MLLPVDQLLALEQPPVRLRYTDRETILYALGVGFGRDPMDEAELPFVYEKSLRAVPTFASVLGFEMELLQRTGVNVLMSLHGGMGVTLHQPLPAVAELLVTARIAAIIDKGREKGALIVSEREMRDAATNALICTARSTTFARADGGGGSSTTEVPVPQRMPPRAPDLVVDSLTREDQALLYALSGDRNEVHRDPAAARVAGFHRPILQGLCTYGICCRAVLAGVCGFDATRIAEFEVRFAAPVFPGETVATEIWVDGREVSFRARVKERDRVVIDNGRCLLRA